MSDYDSDKIHSVKGDVYGVSETQLVEDCTIIKLSPLYNALPFGYSRSRMITRFGPGFTQRAAALLGGLCVFVSAYGLASFGSVESNPEVVAMLGLNKGSTDYIAAKQGGYVCLNPLGMLVGAFCGGILSNKLGRTKGMSIGMLLTILGAVLQVSAQNVTWFSICRVLQGLGIGITDSIVPAWIGEMSPTHVRSGSIAFELLFAGIGVSFATWITYGTSFSDNYGFAWRFPLAFPIAIALVYFSLIHFMPESPRWLVSVGKRDDARYVLNFLRGPEIAARDLARTEEACREQKLLGSSLTYASMFFGKENVRQQLFITLLVQFTGTFFAAYGMILSYSSTVFGFAGYGPNKVALIAGANSVQYALWFLVGVFGSDRVGGRNLVLMGASGMGVMMMVIGGLSKLVISTQSASAGAGLVFCVFLYAAFHGASFATMGWVIPVEIFPQASRSRGAAISIIVFSFGNGLSTMLAPYLFTALNENFFFLFGGLTLLSVPLLFIFVPQTAGRSLEEIERLLRASWFYWRQEIARNQVLESKHTP
ncbi:hypothetical protein JCM8547_005833 [Rhodosporidiobolus lusitaniae]